ncbi:hypothetical protein F5887DRAFT_1072727 [Amanita rubescens]|nr:hypothetical protein F5887DRAFT_925597 [Amanita rubescens]KAF8347211.1 hypothetical protein F5887DRAFT_1072727 [Amanita rubescens]
MVKFTIAPLLLIPAILSAVVLATPVKRQGVETVVQQLVADLAGVNTAASSINNGLTFGNALELNKGIQATHRDLNDGAIAMGNTQNIPADEAESIVNEITGTQSTVENILTVVCAKKTVLQGFPVNMNNLAQARLSGLSDSANSFFTAARTALANAPNVGQLGVVHNAFAMAFTKAIACFSS